MKEKTFLKQIRQTKNKENKEKRPFSIRLFPILVLMVILLFAWKSLRPENPLFQKGQSTTLYVKTEVGTEAVFLPEKYFSKDEIVFSKLAWDFGGVDWNVPGVYQVKLFYDGKETNCTIEVQVLADEKKKAQKMWGASEGYSSF